MGTMVSYALLLAATGPTCSDEPTERGRRHAEIASILRVEASDFKVAEDRPEKPVIALTIHRFYATDAVLERLTSFPELEELTFLEDGTSLRSGHHPTWRITDAGVAHLKRLKHLRALSLPSSEVTDLGVSYLSEMTQLQELGIGNGNGWKVADKKTARPSDESVVAAITDRSVADLNKLQNLRSLMIFGTRLTDDGFRRLNGLVELRWLELRLIDGGITERSLAALAQFPKLTTLHISDARWVNDPIDANLAELRKLPQLEELSIISLRVHDAGVVHLGTLRNLKKLTLYHALAHMPVTDRGLEHLARLDQLKELDVRFTLATEKGVETLRAKLPDAKFVGFERP